MKKLKLILCFSFFTLNFAFCQNWLWGEQGYGSVKSNAYGSPVATDLGGDVYVAGQYDAIIVFGSTILTGSSYNAYLVKFSSAGNVLWAVQPTDSANSESFTSSVATDASGNIYVCGEFTGTVTFGSYKLRGTYSGEAYLVKYDIWGSVIWAVQSKQVSLTRYAGASASSIAIDNAGNPIITGTFSDTLLFGSDTLKGQDRGTIFVVKYNPYGNAIWAAQSSYTALDGGNSALAVASDPSGNALVTGIFSDSLYFGSTLLYSRGNEYSSYTVKYSSGGNLLWATQSENGTVSSECYGNSVVSDNAGNIYTTGYFTNIVKFGSKDLYSPASTAAYLTKCDANGNVLWVKQSSPGWAGMALAADNMNYIYLSGENYDNEIDSLLFGGIHLNPRQTDYDAGFLLKLDTSGISSCGSVLDGIGAYDEGCGIAVDNTGEYVFMSGTFYDDTVFCGSDTMVTKAGGANILTARWKNCGIEGINELKVESEELKVYPNPFTSETTIALNSSGTYNLEVDDITGRKLKSVEFTGSEYVLPAEGLASGLYFVRVFRISSSPNAAGSLIGTRKIILQ